MHEIISIILSVISIVLASIALIYSFYLDTMRIKILSIIPSISGTRPHNTEAWTHSIRSIQVRVKNNGLRNAQNCEGLVTFKRLDALPLFVTNKGDVLTESRSFDIPSKDERDLVAAWHFTDPNNGKSAINGNGFDKASFLEKAPPIQVTITCGQKKITKILSEKELEKLLRKHEEQVYKDT